MLVTRFEKVEAFTLKYIKDFFYANEYDILESFYLLNRKISAEGFARINDLLLYLGRKPTEYGELNGWAEWVDYHLDRPVDDPNGPIDIRIEGKPMNLAKITSSK